MIFRGMSCVLISGVNVWVTVLCTTKHSVCVCHLTTKLNFEVEARIFSSSNQCFQKITKSFVVFWSWCCNFLQFQSMFPENNQVSSCFGVWTNPNFFFFSEWICSSVTHATLVTLGLSSVENRQVPRKRCALLGGHFPHSHGTRKVSSRVWTVCKWIF